MKVVVFGATGRTGRQVVRSAVQGGHHVVAFAHQPDPMSGPGLSNGRPAVPVPMQQALSPVVGSMENITIVPGDIFAPKTLGAAIAGADAVVFAAGSPGQSPTRIRSAGIASVCTVMRDSGVSRIVAVSQAAAFISPRATPVRKLALAYFVHKIYRNPFLDVERMEDELAHAPDLNWSVVRATKVRDWPASGRYHVVPDGQLRREWPVSVADLADYIVARAVDQATGRDTVTVTGAGRPGRPVPGGSRPGRPVAGRPSGRPPQKEGQPR